mmetsp:Transcript_17314/g.34556  ORF Transcript_17314/g.34556 Transcript_17314/m.34556 type:complete len:236 (-) Transcript_17314:266-973(-)
MSRDERCHVMSAALSCDSSHSTEVPGAAVIMPAGHSALVAGEGWLNAAATISLCAALGAERITLRADWIRSSVNVTPPFPSAGTTKRLLGLCNTCELPGYRLAVCPSAPLPRSTKSSDGRPRKALIPITDGGISLMISSYSCAACSGSPFPSGTLWTWSCGIPHTSTNSAPEKHLKAVSPVILSFPKKTCTRLKSMPESFSSTSGFTVVPEPIDIEKPPFASMDSSAISLTLETM